MSTRGTAIESLNRLIGICRAAEASYDRAADREEDLSMRLAYREQARSRSRWIFELEGAVRRLGGYPKKMDAPGPLGKRLQSLRHIVRFGRNRFIAECQQADNKAIRFYEEALARNDQPAGLKMLLQRQYDQIRQERIVPSAAVALNS